MIEIKPFCNQSPIQIILAFPLFIFILSPRHINKLIHSILHITPYPYSNNQMHRSSLIQNNLPSSTRAKTPQTKNSSSLRKRQTQSQVKTSITNQLSMTSTKKIQDKSILLQSLKLTAIQQNPFNNRVFNLGKGNNHEMVRRILLRRKNWVQTQNKDDFLHFKWSQSQWGFKYINLGKTCICFNHFEYHRQVSNKMRIVRNMINYCETNKLNAFNYLPLTYIIDLSSAEEDMALHNFIKFYNRNLPANNTQHRLQTVILPRLKHTNNTQNSRTKRPQGLFYCQPIMAKTFILQDEQGKSPYLWILKPTFMNRGRGVALFNSLQQFQKLIWKYYQGEDLEDYGNRVFNMQEFEVSDEEEEKKKEKDEKKGSSGEKDSAKPQKAQDKKQQKKVQSKVSNQSNKAIPHNQSKTQAIKKQLATKRPSLQTSNALGLNLDRRQTETSGLKVFSFVVQKYIESPMLINERKFDIRVWALLTQNYEVLFFREGYLRFSSFKYSTKHHNNPFIHLTNNSVQKHATEYNQQSGNQMYLSDIKNYMPEEKYTNLQAKIREVIWISMIAARRKINVNGRKECFEIFGYDFMVDSQFKAWLIEVNTNPAIDDCSPMLKAMIPRMLDDAFKLTLDKIFNNRLCDNAQTFPVPNYKDEQNMWESLGDFKQGINEKTMGRKLSFLRR